MNIRFGSYQVERLLARGGMGELFQATRAGARGFSKPVAIKRVRPDKLNEPDVVKLFIREAKLAAAFAHPNLLHVFELFEETGQLFMVMELLEGADLATLLARAVKSGFPIPIPCSVAIVAAAADGLHFAHELRDEDGQALIAAHRDVTPGNLFLTRTGTVKVLDFGIAQVARKEGAAPTTQLRGKMGYLTPEHVAGVPLDRRSDVFGLGIVLFELLSGQRFVPNESLASAVETLKVSDQHASNNLGGVSTQLRDIVVQALDPNPARRFESAA
ncbi:MAG: serine/threonine-protein kinase, partial [Myxococcota bacterium]